MVESVPETINFPGEEEKILKLWKEWDVLGTCLKQSKGKPRYSFYDGPPFATGLPHYGHLLTSTIKDIVPRYAHQSGYHVERRFGWDTHGLPVEYEIDKTFEIKGPEDVAKMGIANYNNECRKIVMRYSNEWEDVVSRLGRWIDFKNDYKTMYPWFMESVWWAFKQLYNKGLVYKGFKVMPFSTACNTPLSNFESGQNYKEVSDPAGERERLLSKYCIRFLNRKSFNELVFNFNKVTVAFPLDDSPDVSMIAWTTTPWTLPSNLALVVNPEKDYIKVKDVATQKMYILMEARIEALYKKPEEYVILDRFKGETLKDKTYSPPFSYYTSLKKRGAFRILNDTYVTEESGTGVVHSAPYFGEEDFRVCLAAGIITKDGELVCPVDESGRFLDPVADFRGQYVKDADKGIIKYLKNAGLLVHLSTVKHSYPFCWRSETPLIYKAVPSWFVRVESMVEKLLETNGRTYWVPDFVKEKRFGNWLRDARDWAISRNRYWGTPIPLWMSEDGKEVVCVGSIQELEELTNTKVTDLHREFVDHLTIPSSTGQGVLRRVTEVFDCWFESGSMPYAQAHYPFENKKEFEESFPADFVAEGIDQTRGWFYTLQVLGTALFDEPAFKNLICNGLILASDGQKMSKRKKNYPDPLEIINKYGADALRLYLINSPAVRGDNLRFKEEGVRDVLKDVFLPWYNAYRFLVQNVERLEKEEGVTFRYNESALNCSENIMDRWIVSFTQSLIVFVKVEMAAYRLYTVMPQLVKFVDNLTNWYVRVNRRRLKGEDGKDDCVHALQTLFGILFVMIRIMASFTPFLTELMYQNLRRLVDGVETSKEGSNDSVHYMMFPRPKESLIDKRIERAVARMQAVIELGRVIRDRKTLPIKYPLPEVVVIHKDQDCLDDVRALEKYILLELNVRALTTSTDKEKYGVNLRAEPDHKTLGARLKSAFKPLVQAIKELTDSELQTFLQSNEMEIQGHKLFPEDVRIMYSFSSEKAKDLADTYEADANNEVLVLLNIKPDQSMQDEGVAREVINRIQKLRKKAKLVPLDEVTLYYSVTPPSDALATVVSSHSTFIESAIRSPLRLLPHPPSSVVIAEEKQQLKGSELKLVIAKGFVDGWGKGSGSACDVIESKNGTQVAQTNGNANNSSLFCGHVNVELCGTYAKERPSYSLRATVLLENPTGSFIIDVPSLLRQVEIVFNLQGCDLKLYRKPNKSEEVDETTNTLTLNEKTLYVFRRQDKEVDGVLSTAGVGNGIPFCRYVNVQLCSGQSVASASILLENPQGSSTMSTASLKQQVGGIFGLSHKNLTLFKSSDKTSELSDNENVLLLHAKTLHVLLK